MLGVTAAASSLPAKLAEPQLRLEQYAEALEELGYDDLNYLSMLGPDKLRQIGTEAGMKLGHAAKFADMLFRS